MTIKDKPTWSSRVSMLFLMLVAYLVTRITESEAFP